MSQSTLRHKSEAPEALRFAVVTISTSKYSQSQAAQLRVRDESGDLMVRLLEAAGFSVTARRLVSDDPEMIRETLLKVLKSVKVDAIAITGGTGVTKRDVTIETVRPMLQKELPGFGELLRRFSYEHIGAASLMTRATAGVRNRKVIFCIPGSPDAVELAVKRLIIPETPHLLKHARE